MTIKKIIPPLARREFQTRQHTTTFVIPNHRCQLLVAPAAAPIAAAAAARCSRSCFAAGTTAARRARRASDGGDDGGDARGSPTTTVGADFADAELADDAGDVAAAAVARDLARGATIPAGGKEAEEEEEEEEAPLAPPAGWRSAASCPLTPPLPFASCTPPLPFASCLPASCRVAPVVAPPPTPPRDFASTSSLPSGCCNSQRPTCRAAVASRPLAVFASRRATSASRSVAAS